MADQNDVRRSIALSLPGPREGKDHFAFSVENKGKQKGFAWVWVERVKPRKPRVPRADVLAVRVRDDAEKAALLAGDPDSQRARQGRRGPLTTAPAPVAALN